MCFLSCLRGKNARDDNLSSDRNTPARPVVGRTHSDHSTDRVPYGPFHEQPTWVQEAYRAEVHMQPVQDRQTRGTNSHGAWYCCHCRHENQVTHRSGKSPFGRMNCGNCNRFYCASCVTTHILGQEMVGPRPYAHTAVFVPHYNDQEVPYGLVCPSCGLSRRAEGMPYDQLGVQLSLVQFGDLRCRCGNYSNCSWHRFSIGSPYDWLGDRTACYGRALMKRVDRAGHDTTSMGSL